MPEKVFGIPIREAMTVGGLLIAIGIAWGTSQTGIASNAYSAKRNHEKIKELKKELKDEMRQNKQELKQDIRENRQMLQQILRELKR